MGEYDVISVWPEWEIIDLLGEGKYGKVYSARKTDGDEIVYGTIKVINVPYNTELAGKAVELGMKENHLLEYFRKFKNDVNWELTVCKMFVSPNVLPVDEVKIRENLDSIGWQVFVRTAYHKTLGDLLENRAIGRDTVVRLGFDIAKAIEVCCGSVHGEIRPSNILCSSEGVFMLRDFGIKRCLEKAGAALFGEDDHAFDAPEVKEDRKYSTLSDIYSTALVMCWALNGGQMPENTVLEDDDELNAVLQKALAENPEDRYQNAKDFVADLENILLPPMPEEPEEVEEEHEELEEEPETEAEESEEAETGEDVFESIEAAILAEELSEEIEELSEEIEEVPAEEEQADAEEIIEEVFEEAEEEAEEVFEETAEPEEEEFEEETEALEEEPETEAEEESEEAETGEDVFDSIEAAVMAVIQEAEEEEACGEEPSEEEEVSVKTEISVEEIIKPFPNIQLPITPPEEGKDYAKEIEAEVDAIVRKQLVEEGVLTPEEANMDSEEVSEKEESSAYSYEDSDDDGDGGDDYDYEKFYDDYEEKGKKRKGPIIAVILLIVAALAAVAVFVQPWQYFISDDAGNEDPAPIEEVQDDSTSEQDNYLDTPELQQEGADNTDAANPGETDTTATTDTSLEIEEDEYLV